LIIAGIDLGGLAHADPSSLLVFPDPTPGRVAHIDADFLAYQASFERRDDPKTFEEMKSNARIMVENLRLLSGAETVHLHLTPGTSDKGKRYEIALLKEYQANRKDKEKPRYLHIIRHWFTEHYPGTLHQRCEADDGMASEQYAAIARGDRARSIIVSKDKDLAMVPGLHMDWDEGTIVDVDFGSIWIDDKGSSKKLRGFGEKFFWAQLLMGDSADNISGLPVLHSKLVAYHSPPTSLVEAKTVEAYNRELRKVKPKKCGPVLAHAMLENADTAKMCFDIVTEAFKLGGPYANWRDGTEITWQQAFLSECKLLWMRKDPHNENCVLDYIRRIGK
jgi:hypothetical protein